ncbi:hypothetical protein SP41_88 [Salmonella phage 41]|nr:hypothetical protein SP41_88 [Salmonella phage 41]
MFAARLLRKAQLRSDIASRHNLQIAAFEVEIADESRCSNKSLAEAALVQMEMEIMRVNSWTYLWKIRTANSIVRY